jgi:hypothetical protein
LQGLEFFFYFIPLFSHLIVEKNTDYATSKIMFSFLTGCDVRRIFNFVGNARAARGFV